MAELKKGNNTINTYFHRMKALSDSLTTIGEPLRDAEFVSYILVGLNEEYDALYEVVTNRTTPIPVRDLFSQLQSIEQRKLAQAFPCTTLLHMWLLPLHPLLPMELAGVDLNPQCRPSQQPRHHLHLSRRRPAGVHLLCVSYVEFHTMLHLGATSGSTAIFWVLVMMGVTRRSNLLWRCLPLMALRAHLSL
jgi:hypothetical protein